MILCRRHPPGLFTLFLLVLFLTPGCGGGGGSPEPGQSNQVPLVNTMAATSTTTTTSTLNGNANPNGKATVARFEWGQNPDLAGAATTADQAVGDGVTSVTVAAPLSGLTASTTYHYRVVATSSAGTTNGSIASFTTATPNDPPTVQSLGTTGITTGGATLNGNANPNGKATVARFEWGQNPDLAGAATTADQAVGDGVTSVAVATPLSGLTASTTYHYRVVATSSAGTTNGSIASFTTAAPNDPPTVQTLGTTGITTGGATLNGNANPNGKATVAHFECSLDPNLVGATPTPDQAVGSGSAGVPLSVPLDVLIPSTTYYYRLVATNDVGTSNGTIFSFTTSGNPTPEEGIIFSQLFSVFGGSGIFSIDFTPIREHGSGGHISIRIMDTPTTYFEFSTLNASDPSKASFIKVRRGFVVDSASFPFPYSQGGTYPIRISMGQTLSTVEAFGGTASLTRSDTSNPLVYFEIWTSDQDAYYDNILMEPGFLDNFSTDTTGTFNLFYISGTNSTFIYDPAGQRALVRTGNGGP